MKILISLGPLRAYIDDVRFITNRSTGTLGYKILEAALLRRHQVKAVVGVCNFLRPQGIKEWIEVEEYHQLKQAMETHYDWADVIVMAAAVPDFLPEKKFSGKIPRSQKVLILKLKASESILGTLAKKKQRDKKLIVGFSLEKENSIEKAIKKFQEHKLDLMVSAILDELIPPFGGNPLSLVLIEKDRIERLPLWRKYKTGEYILNRIEELWYKKFPRK